MKSVNTSATVAGRVNATSAPSGSPHSIGFDWAMAILSAAFVGGVFLDGWAHTHGRVDQSFFTPWHAVFYAGYAATASVLAVSLLRNHARCIRSSASRPAWRPSSVPRTWSWPSALASLSAGRSVRRGGALGPCRNGRPKGR